MTDNNPLVIWRFTDGKPGHENQALGLIQALSDMIEVKVFDIQPESFFQTIKYYIKKSFPMLDRLPPLLIIGVGHATHLSVLAAKRSVGGRAVILMKPSWPTWLFDYCVVPEHDGFTASNHVITTIGVLNRIVPSEQLDQNIGLILIGGPSSHYEWFDDAMLERIEIILAKDKKQWLITTSRRTPESFVSRLKKLPSENLEVIIASDTGKDWLPQQLQRAATVWITEDSVSMVYEALTAGGDCGILPVQRKQESRVSAGIDQLIEKRRLISFDAWMLKGKMLKNDQPINESKRIAEYLLQHD